MRLIDGDALIKWINDQRCADCPDKQDERCAACQWDDAIMSIETAPTIGGWISVKDRLPEPYETVAVIAKADCWSYCLGWLNGDEWVIAEEASEEWAVTHWMPLPEPPKEVSGDGETA
jgi:hypothetical protein